MLACTRLTPYIPRQPLRFSGWWPFGSDESQSRSESIRDRFDWVVKQLPEIDSEVTTVLNRGYLVDETGANLPLTGYDFLKLIDEVFDDPYWKSNGYYQDDLEEGDFLLHEHFLPGLSGKSLDAAEQAVVDLEHLGLIEKKFCFYGPANQRPCYIYDTTPAGEDALVRFESASSTTEQQRREKLPPEIQAALRHYE